jgi:hypothetical protein
MFPRNGKLSNLIGRTAVASVSGGYSAKIGGGKFANGAVSAAFSHLFNTESGLVKQKRMMQMRILSSGSGVVMSLFKFDQIKNYLKSLFSDYAGYIDKYTDEIQMLAGAIEVSGGTQLFQYSGALATNATGLATANGIGGVFLSGLGGYTVGTGINNFLEGFYGRPLGQDIYYLVHENAKDWRYLFKVTNI